MDKTCEFIEVTNDIGVWTVPAQFAPQSVGGDNPKVSGVIGLTAIGEPHSVHIIKVMLWATWLKEIVAVEWDGLTGTSSSRSQEHPAIFVDAGAHIGTVTVPVGQALFDENIESKFYSIELLPEIYHCLTRNIENNLNPAALTVNAALTSHEIADKVKLVNVPSICEGWDFNTKSATAGCFTYSVEDLGVASHKVPTTTIDALLESETSPVTAIKVDCEGTDLDVLRGAINTIKKSRPVILFEDNTDKSKTKFLIDKEKTKPDSFWLRVQNLLNDEFESFFDEINYTVVRNWLYTSWSEFVAVPNEDIGKIIKLENSVFNDIQPGDYHSSEWRWKSHPDLPQYQQLANILYSIFHSWGEKQTKKWFREHEEIVDENDFYDYVKELLKC